jgi:hypothetical protein
VHAEVWKGPLFDSPEGQGRMAELIARFCPVIVVFDAQPNLEDAERTCKAFHGRVWRAMYPPQDMLVLVEPYTVDKDDPDYVVRISRNSMMSHVARLIKATEVQIPLLDDCPGGAGMDLLLHLTKPSMVFDGGDQKKGKWIGGPDHLFHALGYACAGLIMLGNVMPMSISSPGLMKL